MGNSADVKHKRVRLRPEVRKAQILEATLEEFGAHGYAATSVEKIAQRAGLSKAGLYAHFSGKDEIFEALLMKVLVPLCIGVETLRLHDGSLEHIVDAFISTAYSRLEDPTFLAVMRLMVAEGDRSPHLLKRWRTEVFEPYLAEQQSMVDLCVERGLVRASALTANFSLILAPAVFGSLWRMIADEEVGRRELMQLKKAHRQFLMEALEP